MSHLRHEGETTPQAATPTNVPAMLKRVHAIKAKTPAPTEQPDVTPFVGHATAHDVR